MKSCPGAVQFRNDSLYYTLNESVCNKSIRPQAVPWSLSMRRPFKVREIVQICLLTLNMLVGTIENALVIKHFAEIDASGNPGSHFVVVFAGVDFISSIWMPAYLIVHTLYYTVKPLKTDIP